MKTAGGLILPARDGVKSRVRFRLRQRESAWLEVETRQVDSSYV